MRRHPQERSQRNRGKQVTTRTIAEAAARLRAARLRDAKGLAAPLDSSRGAALSTSGPYDQSSKSPEASTRAGKNLFVAQQAPGAAAALPSSFGSIH